MKTILRIQPVALAVGVVLAFTTTLVHADDEKPVRRHRHVAKADKVDKADITTLGTPHSRVKGSGRIPTRDGRHSQDAAGREVGGANGPEYRVQTGSHIPKKYNRRGYTTDSDQNVQIIDENDQRFRSRDTVGEILRTDPSIRVSGPRGL